jgi:hypothetical protein
VTNDPLGEAAQALKDAGQALQRLASGPLGLGPSILTIGKYAREAGEKLVVAGEQLQRASDGGLPNQPTTPLGQ